MAKKQKDPRRHAGILPLFASKTGRGTRGNSVASLPGSESSGSGGYVVVLWRRSPGCGCIPRIRKYNYLID